ncbi:MAG: GYF domain-containing protein [Bacteroidota bacterium]
MEFYLHDGQEQHGPFSVDELRKRPAFKPDTLIWYEGIPEWKPARSIEELKGFFKTPPPLPIKANHKSEPPKASSSELLGTVAGRTVAKTSSYFKPLLTAIIVVVLVATAYGLYNKYQTNQATEDRRVHIRDNIRSYVTIGNSEYKILGLGGINGLSIEVANNTEYLLDNVRVQIRYIKSNGETWKEEVLDFALVPPNRKMTLRAPDSDRGTSIDYKIVSIKSSALGL